MAKAIFPKEGMLYQFWAKAAKTIVFLLNRSPIKTLDKMTRFEAYNGRKPWIAQLKVFGSQFYVHISSNLRHKLESNSYKCIFMEYGTSEKGYVLFSLVTKKIVLPKNLVFDDNGSWDWKANTERYQCATFY